MSDFFITLVAADAPIVIPSVDRVLVSVIVGMKSSLMDTAVAVAVQVVVVVVNLENFESRHVFWIILAGVGKRREVIFEIFFSRVLHDMRIVFVFCVKAR